MQSTMPRPIHHTISTLACLALAGTLAACGSNDDTPTPPGPGNANAPTITFDVTTDPTRTYAGAFPGDTFTNTANATAKGKCTTPPTVFTYTSTDTTNAPVHPTTGLVTYTAAGSYTITAATQAETSGDSVCAAARATYILSIDQANADFTFDSSITRRVGIKGGTALYLERVRGIPSDINAGVDTGGAISYSSADPSKASVDASTGVVTGVDNTPGEVRITATYSGSKNYKETTAGYTLEISDKVPKSISFTNPQVTADYAGANPGSTTTQLGDVSVDRINSQCKTPPGVTYSSSDGTNASVDASGEVTYTAAGTYIITATTDQITATTDQETSGDSVVCYPISSAYILKVNKATADLAFDSSTDKAGAGGGMTTYLARLGDTTGGDTTTDNMGGAIRYYTADTSKATVDANSGTVTAIYSGTDVTTVVIYARYLGSRNYNNIIGSATTKPNYTLYIGRVRPTVSFNGLAAGDLTHDVTYGGARGVTYFDITADATVDAHNGYCAVAPVPVYTSSDAANASVDATTGAVTYTAAGTYTITATTPVAPGCAAASNQYTLNVAKANAELIFDRTSDVKVAAGGQTRNLASLVTDPTGDTAAGKSGTITYYSADPSKATVDPTSGQVTAGDSTGDITIYASFTGDNYNNITGSATTKPNYTLSISDTVPRITFAEQSPAAQTYLGASPGGTFTNVATATTNGQCTSLPSITYTSSDSTNASVDATTGKVTYTAAGSYIITATTEAKTSGGSVCEQTSNAYDLIVNKADAVLAFDRTTDKAGAGGGMTTNLARISNSLSDPTTDNMGGTISYYSDNTSIATVNANSGEVTAVYSGTTAVTVVIYASYTGSPNYNNITGENRENYTLNIDRVTPTIAFKRNGSAADVTSVAKTYNGALKNSGNTYTNITADATVDANNGYCPTAPAIVYSSSHDTKASVVASGAVTYTAAGGYTITATTAVAPGCAAASNQYTLNVAKANARLTFDRTSDVKVATKGKIQNLASLVPETIIGDTDAGKIGIIRYYSADTNKATVDASGTVTAKENTGDITIYASFTGDNYNNIGNDTTGQGYTLSISDTVPIITFAKTSTEDLTQIYAGASGGTFINVAAAAANGQCTSPPTPSYRSSDDTNASVDASGEVTYTAAGSYIITATTEAKTSGGSVCNAISASYTLIVNKANLTASLFADDASVDVSTGRFVVYPADPQGITGDTTTGVSGGSTISYTSDNTEDVTVDATTGRVTSRKLDTTADVTINASFTGSRNYNDATDSYTLKIRNSVPVISFADITGDATSTSVIYAGAAGDTYTQVTDVTATAPGTGAYCIPPQDLVVTYDITTDGTSADAGAKVDATGETAGRVTYYAATPADSHYTITATTAVAPGCAAASKSYTLTVDKASPTLTFASSTLNVAPNRDSTTENTTDSPTITLEGVGGDSTGNGTLDGVSITYYSSDTTNGATVDASGIVTVKTTVAANVEITATYSGSSNYENTTDSYTLNIAKSAPLVRFVGITDNDATSVIYAGAAGDTYTQAATDATNGVCITAPGVTYSISGSSNNPIGDTTVDASGTVTYYAATLADSHFTITATTVITPNCAAADASYALTVKKADVVDFTFDNPTTTVGIGETITNDATFTGVGGDSSTDMGGTISYSSPDTDKVTVDASTGAVTGEHISGTSGVTIIATYAGSDNYNDKTRDYSLTVTLTAADLDVSGSPIKKLIFSWQDVTDAVLYRLREDPDGTSDAPFAQVGQDATGVQSITHIVPLYARIDAKYELQSCFSDNTVDCVTADTTTDTTKTLTKAQLDAAIGYIKASNTDAGDEFGTSVSLSADGRTMAVGAPGESSDATGIGGTDSNDNSADSGAVYVFTRNATTDDWSQQAYIKASNTGAGDEFGASLSLSADGNTLAVGATKEASDATGIGGDDLRDNSADSGAVYVFTRTGNTWEQQAYIKASNTGISDEFGASLSLSADGTTLAVGATKEDSDATGVGNIPSEWSSRNNNDVTDAGAVYVFRRISTDWTQDAYIKASNTGSGDLFGHSLSLSADGTTLAVGATKEASDATGVDRDGSNNNSANSGAVYVFTRTGNTWAQRVYIKASNTGAGDEFGYSIGLDASGETMAVGAYGVNGKAGAVYVFTRTVSTWSEQTDIQASNKDGDDEFGKTLSLSADGNTLAVGARKESSNATGVATGVGANNSAPNAGAAYVFTRTGSTWSEQAYIKASNTKAEGGDEFGKSVSLSADGATLAVGAKAEKSSATGTDGDGQDLNNASGAGAVYLY